MTTADEENAANQLRVLSTRLGKQLMMNEVLRWAVRNREALTAKSLQDLLDTMETEYSRNVNGTH